MKKTMILIAVFAFVAAAFVIDAAATIDNTVSITATGSVTGSTTLSVLPTSIAYGTSSTDKFPTTPSNSKVVVSYTSNYNPWQIDIYTNNTAIPMHSASGPYSKGGLVAGTGTTANLCVLKWVAKIGTNTTVPSVPTASTYNYVKDLRDEDDPVTTTQNESWATGFASGYPNIAYGDSSGKGYCVDPTNGPSYQGDAVTPASGVAVYIAGMWATGGVSPAVPAAAGSYSGTIYFDLYHP